MFFYLEVFVLFALVSLQKHIEHLLICVGLNPAYQQGVIHALH